MSHFTVLVVGPNHDKQLQPFHEFECTGENDEFVQDVDVTAETREHGADWYGLEVIDKESNIDTQGDHKYGYCLVKDLHKEAVGDNVVKAINRTNPNKKWDWWVVGGRWSNSLLLKGGDIRVDQATKGAIDFDKMRDQAGMEAAVQYDKVAKIIDGRAWLSWKEVREKHVDNIDAARQEFHAQDVIKDFQKPENRDMFGFFEDFSSYKLTREEYIARARASAVSFFALLKDGQWYQRGDMGWWGMVSNEEDTDTWNQKFQELLDSLSDDTLLTVVDCHI